MAQIYLTDMELDILRDALVLAAEAAKERGNLEYRSDIVILRQHIEEQIQ